MKKILPILLIVSILVVSSVGITGVIGQTTIINNKMTSVGKTSGYVLQWSQNYGTDPRTCARYQGPQPIGDADNDGKNELLISGRDEAVRVMKWDDATQNYTQVRVIRPPFYPFMQCDAGGMAIGDVTNNGKNEVTVTWYAAIYKYFVGKYWLIGMNPWIFMNEGGSADCYIGDCDNDGKNEVIMSGGPGSSSSPVPEITVFRWNGLWLQKVAGWKDPNVDGYVYMAGLGDVDDDGLNEIVCAYSNRVVVLKWNAENKTFDSTVIFSTMHQQDSPFSIVCKDCDNDGKAEILLGYYAPHITIFKWNGTGYEIQFDISWPGADPIIE
jgi:hypothetical protein